MKKYSRSNKSMEPYVCVVIVISFLFVSADVWSEYYLSKSNIKVCADRDVYIAEAQLITNRTDFAYSVAEYKIIKAIAGSFPEETVPIIYYTSTRADSLPTNALLLLKRENDQFYAIGNHASKGILPNCSLIHELFMRDSIEKLIITSPIANQISSESALEIAQKYMAKQHKSSFIFSVECNCERYEFGWEVMCNSIDEDGNYLVDGLRMIVISDDKKIIYDSSTAFWRTLEEE
ncbi:MAG: hypothetical protein EOM20_07370 [Spartobacteria bacterium]|nr:hypothetical protein [Spartobacteria bacterium]